VEYDVTRIRLYTIQIFNRFLLDPFLTKGWQ
jgi:hypothetical protein